MTIRTKIPPQLSFQPIFPPTPIFPSVMSLPYPANPFVPSVNLRERNHEGFFRLLQENKKTTQYKEKTESKFPYFIL